MDKGGDNVGSGEAITLAKKIWNDNNSLVKLMATGILLNSAKAKLELYMEKNKRIINQIVEDESSLEMFDLYFIETESQLRESANQSLFTAKEAEIAIDACAGEEYGR